MLTSIAVSHLTSMNSATKSGIAYLYLDYVRQEQQGIRNLMAGLLRQLAYADGTVDECVKSLYRKTGKNSRPSREELAHALEISIGKFDRTFLIVDALDESKSNCREDLVSMLLMLQYRFEVNIFATSREDAKISRLFGGHKKVLYKQILGSHEDLGRYLDLELLKLIEHRDLVNEAKRSILQIAEGVQVSFVTLQRSASSSQEFWGALHELRESVSSETPGALLHDIYEKTVNHIECRKDKLADRVLLCIVSWRERTRLIDLQKALAIAASGRRREGANPTNLGPETEDRILSACLGLLTIDRATGYVRFVHQTAHEYFESVREQKFQDADAHMAKICITCLSISPIPRSIENRPEEEYAWEACPPLYGYAARHWGHHARKATKCLDEVVEFLEQPKKVYLAGCALIASIYIPDSRLWADNPEVLANSSGSSGSINAFHLVAFFGLEQAFRSLLGIGQSQRTALLPKHRFGKRLSVEATIYRWTPLHFAALGGQEGLTRLLLDYGATVNAEDLYRQTPLALAHNMDRHENRGEIVDRGENRREIVDRREKRGEIVDLLKRAGGKPMVENRTERGIKWTNHFMENFIRISL
ncbi:hypothetical protein TOPH_03890 [Tolypocladium ophioglossoides CBS 100239]|uniref:Nephrocystin 3-like N-terminal domain-containing protein n=1 Tax=Tolypocladium ophioglossoides (strain CBS 100239) TaxID=1163406 RepID=A0A0L0NCN5_TOLOC|nr:hypothetical protein TOPH_03890 [Tolypocladium ophioglossoides CBS 100239]